ncbi:hypothetical protein ACFE04_021777 [Oxalis oulophora]
MMINVTLVIEHNYNKRVEQSGMTKEGKKCAISKPARNDKDKYLLLSPHLKKSLHSAKRQYEKKELGPDNKRRNQKYLLKLPFKIGKLPFILSLNLHLVDTNGSQIN